MDGGDLDVIPRAEREDENRFGVECDATGKVAVQPRLYDAEMLVMHAYAPENALDVHEPRCSLESHSTGRSRTVVQDMIRAPVDRYATHL